MGIVLRREMARQPPGSPVLAALIEQYEYDAIQTCAVDGSCMRACPVAIDTGRLIKAFRRREHREHAERAALVLARRYRRVERIARGALRAGGGLAARMSGRTLPAPAPSQLPFTVPEGAAAVYLPSCVNRIFGNAPGEAEHPPCPRRS